MDDIAERSETKQVCTNQFTKELIATMTDEIVEDFDEVFEEAPVNDLCHEEVGYAQAAAINLGAHMYASEKLADADD